MQYPTSLGEYLATNFPASKAYAYDDGKSISLVDWDKSDGKRPSPEDVEAWVPDEKPTKPIVAIETKIALAKSAGTATIKTATNTEILEHIVEVLKSRGIL